MQLIVLLLAIYVILLYAKKGKAPQKATAAATADKKDTIVQPAKVKDFKEAQNNYFYACVNKYLAERYPDMKSWQFRDEDKMLAYQTYHICLVYTGEKEIPVRINTADIFNGVKHRNEDFEEFNKSFSERVIRNTGAKILVMAEKKRETNKYSFAYTLSKDWTAENIRTLQDFLLEAGYDSEFDQSKGKIHVIFPQWDDDEE